MVRPAFWSQAAMKAARGYAADRRAAAVVHALGVATVGMWGGALLLWPDRVRAGLGSRALPWYQREVALLDLGHLSAAVLSARRPAGRAHLRALSVTALLLAAGHALEAARYRQGRLFHGLASMADAGWAVTGLLCSRVDGRGEA